MSEWIFKKYINLLSPRLDKFKWKGDHTANFRCPFCGDSQKNKIKSRGYLFFYKGSYVFKCHNCTMACGLDAVIKHMDMTLYSEYRQELFQARNTQTKKPEETQQTFENPLFLDLEALETLPSLDSLPEDHIARVYVKNRMIPETTWNTLYFAENFQQWAKGAGVANEDSFAHDLQTDARLVIPFFSQEKRLIAAQGRALKESTLRYSTAKFLKGFPSVFGLDKMDTTKTVAVLEGPIDSMFLDNAIATATLPSKSIMRQVGITNCVLVFDNNPRNANVVSQMRKEINQGSSVFVWPSSTSGKDVNDMVMSGVSAASIDEMISNNTFENLEAMLALNSWKKV